MSSDYPPEGVIVPEQVEQPPALKTEIYVDKNTRTVRIEFTHGEQFTAFTFSKHDAHILIDGLLKAVNSIGSRVVKAGK